MSDSSSLENFFDVPAGSPMPGVFARMYAEFDSLVESYNKHQIDQATLAEKLSRLRYAGSANSTWTIGASSRSWYKKGIEGHWEQVSAPTDADLNASDLAMRSSSSVDGYGPPGPPAARSEWPSLDDFGLE